jgi:hypothetical protein
MTTTTEPTPTATDLIRRELTPLICRLADPATPTDEIAEVMGRLECVVAAARELMDAGKAALGERIRETGKPVEYGETLWVLSATKETKCIDKDATLAALLEQFGPAAVARDYLAAQPFRHGSIRRALGDDEFSELFVVKVRETVELKKLDTRFLTKDE